VKNYNTRARPEVERALVEYAAGCRRATQNSEKNPSLADFLRKEHLGWMADSRLSFYASNYSAGLNLSGADLSSLNFMESVFPEADFSNAILRKTEMRFTDLEGCNFTGAHMAETDLKGARLTDTKGIFFVERKGWSGTSIIAVPDGPERIAIKMLRLRLKR
jgi:hypothetical protein